MTRQEQIEEAAKNNKHAPNLFSFIQGAQWADANCDHDYEDQALRYAEMLTIAVTALKDAREQFALMAEGEGPDPEVYVRISSFSMSACDEALAKIEALKETK